MNHILLGTFWIDLNKYTELFTCTIQQTNDADTCGSMVTKVDDENNDGRQK